MRTNHIAGFEARIAAFRKKPDPSERHEFCLMLAEMLPSLTNDDIAQLMDVMLGVYKRDVALTDADDARKN